MIKILGFCASPRVGNSLYLLKQSLAAMEERSKELGENMSIDTCTIRGKKLSGCTMCQACMKDGTCAIKDDFQALREKWLEADIIIYSVPVYHMGVPAQLKAFFDRLGNSMFGVYKKEFPGEIDKAMKPLKVIGCISQGIHVASGQEHTMTQVINHALISGCIPVAGDMWESYIGAGGWTTRDESRKALERQIEEGCDNAEIILRSSKSLGVRALDLAVLLKNGGRYSPQVMQDKMYLAFKKKL